MIKLQIIKMNNLQGNNKLTNGIYITSKTKGIERAEWVSDGLAEYIRYRQSKFGYIDKFLFEEKEGIMFISLNPDYKSYIDSEIELEVENSIHDNYYTGLRHYNIVDPGSTHMYPLVTQNKNINSYKLFMK